MGEGGQGSVSPLKNHKNMGFLSKTDPDRLKKQKAINVGPSNAI